MVYEDFIKCWSFISVFDWFPEKALPPLSSNFKRLAFKSTLFTQWKIHQFEEVNQKGTHPKFYIEIRCSTCQVIFTICQTLRDESKKNQTAFTLHLYKVYSNVTTRFFNNAALKKKFFSSFFQFFMKYYLKPR